MTDISKNSRRNKKPYKRKDLLLLYTLDHMDLWMYETKFMKNIAIDSWGIEKKAYLEKYTEKNKYFKCYASLSSVLVRFAVFQSTQYNDAQQQDSLMFTEEYLKFRNRYSITLSLLLEMISNNYPFHRFDWCFEWLNEINAMEPDFFKWLPKWNSFDKDRDGFPLGFDKERDGFPLGLDKRIEHFIYNTSQEQRYHREMQLIKQVEDNFAVSQKYINDSVRRIEKRKEIAYVDAFILWFEHKDLRNHRIQIKQVLSIFFKRMKMFFKNTEAFYIKQVSFDCFVGLQLDLVLIYSESKYFSVLHSHVADLWKQCCLEISPQAQAKAAWVYGGSVGRTLVLRHWLQVCSQNSFIKLDLPLIKTFSKGKFHAG